MTSNDVVKNIENVIDALSKYQDKVSQLDDNYLNKIYGKNSDAINKVKADINDLNDTINFVSQHSLSLKFNAGSINTDILISSYNQILEIVKEIEAEYTRLNNITPDGLKNMANQVDAMAKKIRTGLTDYRGNTGESGVYSFLSDIIKQFPQESEQYINLAEKLKDSENKVLQQRLNEIKSFVKEQEILTGKRFEFNGKQGYQAESDYYTQQLSKFKEGTQEYIQVLNLKRQAEANAAKESEQLRQKQAHEQIKAIEDTKNRINSVLGTIGKISQAINNAINKIIGAIRSVLSVVKTVFNTSISIITGFKNTISKIISLFGNLGNRVKSVFTGVSSGSSKASNSVNILSGTFTELKSKIDLVSSALSKLFNNAFTTNALNLYQSIYSFKNIVGRDLTQATIDWGNSMERVFGLSSRHMVADLNELSGTIYGLGMQASDVPLASENILVISRYLASMGAAGGNATEVMNKLQSALAGMPRSAYSLGFRLDIEQINQYLKGLKAMGGEYANIGTNVSELNTQAQTYVRLSAMLSQFKSQYDRSGYSFLDSLSDSMDTATGRITQFKEAVYNMTNVIGQALTEAFGKIANFVTYIVNFITAKVIQIAEFLKLDMDYSADTNASSKAFVDLGDSAEDTTKKIEGVEDATKKATKSLFGFDKVTKLSSNKSDSSGSSGGAGVFDYTKLLPSVLDGLDEFEGKTETLNEKIKKQLKDWQAAFDKFAKDKTNRANFDLEFNWETIEENLRQTIDNIKAFLGKWGNFGIEIGLKFLDDINIGLIITKISELVNKFTQVANIVTDTLIPAFRTLYDETLKPIVEWLGGKIVEAIDFCILKLDEFSNWFIEHKDDITNFITDTLPENVKEIGKRIGEAFNALFKGEIKLDTYLNAGELEYGDTWINFLKILRSINSIGQSVATIVSDLAKSFGGFLKDNVLPWLNEQLDKFAKWLDAHKKEIEDLLTKIGSFAWENFKLFIDAIGKLVDYAVENPDAIVNMFKGIMGLKIVSFFGSLASNIGKTVVELKALQAIKNLGSLSALGGASTAATAGASAGSAATAGATATATGAGVGAGVAGATGAGALAAGGAIVGLVGSAIAVILKTPETIKGIDDGIQSFLDGEDPLGIKRFFDTIAVRIRQSKGAEIPENLKYILEDGQANIADAEAEYISHLTQTGINSIDSAIVGIEEKFNAIVSDSSLTIAEKTLKLDELMNSTMVSPIDDLNEKVVQIMSETGTTYAEKTDKLNTLYKESLMNPLDELGVKINQIANDSSLTFSERTDKINTLLNNTLVEPIDVLNTEVETSVNNSKSSIQNTVGTSINNTSNSLNGIFTSVESETNKKISENKSLISNIGTSISNIFKGIGDAISGIWNKVQGRGDYYTPGTIEVGTNRASTYSVDTQRIKLTEFAGFRATGGTIPRGSAVIANEGGNLEMIGKVPGGQSVVANNNMITEQIYKAVRNGINDSRGGSFTREQPIEITIKNEGINIYDEATLNQFARNLAPLMRQYL